MENKGRFSVIIPAFNAEKTLARCAASAAGQGAAEILVIDDGSRDGTGKLAGELAEQIPALRVIRQENLGVSGARNRGIREASGEWILFLDADDALLPGAAEALLSAAGEADACCGGILRGGEKRKNPREPARRMAGRHEKLDWAMEAPTDRLTVHGWIFRRSVCLEQDVFFNPELRLGEDSDFVIRYLGACGAAVFTGAPVYRYTVDPESAVHGWKPGQEAAFRKTLEAIGGTEAAQEKNWPLFVLTTLLLILTHDTFHPANPAGRGEQREAALRLRESEPFAGAFRRADLSRLGPEKRWTLRFLRRGRVWPVRLAVRLRQKQNAKRSGQGTAEPTE